MTEKEKMLKQQLYDANHDTDLKLERVKAKELCHQYNQLYFFQCFIAVFALLWPLFATLDSTVSTYSTAVCSQTCGQKPLSEHPRDRGQKAVFHSLPECRGRMLRRSGLPHCTSAGEVKQVLYAGTGGAEFASL